jgi:hypothetical protein
MEIKFSVKILKVAMAVDKARQNGLALDVDHLSAGGNSDVAVPTDCLEPARLDHDGRIVDRRPTRAIDQFSTLHNERLPCHVFFPPLSRSAKCYEIGLPSSRHGRDRL